MMQDCLNQFQILFQAIQFCFNGWRQLRTGKDHWNSPTPWTYQLYAYIYICTYMCCIHINIYSISPFCACFFSFFPSSFHLSSRRGLSPSYPPEWGADCHRLNGPGNHDHRPSRCPELGEVGGSVATTKAIGVTLAASGCQVSVGPQHLPSTNVCRRRPIRGGAAFWCWWFCWKQRYGGLQKRFWEGLDMESYGKVRSFFPWILKQFGHVHSKTVWTFAREQRIRRACVTLPSNSELVWCALENDLSQTRRLHNFRDAAFKVKKSWLHE